MRQPPGTAGVAGSAFGSKGSTRLELSIRCSGFGARTGTHDDTFPVKGGVQMANTKSVTTTLERGKRAKQKAEARRVQLNAKHCSSLSLQGRATLLISLRFSDPPSRAALRRVTRVEATRAPGRRVGGSRASGRRCGRRLADTVGLFPVRAPPQLCSSETTQAPTVRSGLASFMSGDDDVASGRRRPCRSGFEFVFELSTVFGEESLEE